jgi:hypothetical protein
VLGAQAFRIDQTELYVITNWKGTIIKITLRLSAMSTFIVAFARLGRFACELTIPSEVREIHEVVNN